MQDSAKECQRLCTETLHCHVFTYDVNNNYCWLKKADNFSRNGHSGRISGTRHCGHKLGPNNEWLGHGIVLLNMTNLHPI